MKRIANITNIERLIFEKVVDRGEQSCIMRVPVEEKPQQVVCPSDSNRSLTSRSSNSCGHLLSDGSDDYYQDVSDSSIHL